MRRRARGAIVIGGYINGLGLLRGLAARNVPSAVVTTHPHDVAHRSRWVSGNAAAPDLDQRPEQLLEILRERDAEWAGWALIPGNDEALTALAVHHERLSLTHTVVAPPWEIARRLLDKSLLLEVARAVGAPLPHEFGPAVEATAELPALRFPVIVKPSISHRFRDRFGVKVFVAADRAELRRAIARLVGAGFTGAVFDLIPGGDERIYAHCTYLDARGEPSGGLTVRKLRQNPPLFGVARVAEIAEPVPALREITVEMLRRIGFRGMASAEFKLDPRDGTYRLLEINGRSVIYNGLLRRAGLDLGGLAWSETVDGRAEKSAPNGWPGVWINLHADILYSLAGRDPRLGLADFVRPYTRPVEYAVWSAQDPMPFALQWGRTGLAAATALGSHARRRLVERRA